MSKEYTVFISHSWDHNDTLNDLISLIDRRSHFHAEYSHVSRDEPINSSNGAYIKSVLRKKILASNIIIGLAGIFASHSDWMTWELDTAIELGIPIIGVVPRGRVNVSTMVSARAIELVRWNTESIITSIRNHAL